MCDACEPRCDHGYGPKQPMSLCRLHKNDPELIKWKECWEGTPEQKAYDEYLASRKES